MRIAHVQPYDHSVSGGVREHVVNLARHQRAMGHDVTVIASASRPEEVDPEVVLVAKGAVPIRAAKSVARVPLSPLAWWRVRGAVQRGGFDVVHIHEPLLPALSMAATCHARTTTVGTIHGYRPEFLLYRIFRRPLDRLIRRLSARVAVSIDARRWVSQYFPGTYNVIPDGVDVARFSDPSVEPVEALDDGRPNVLFVGRLEPRKGFPVLVDSWGAVKDQVPDARLVVVGHFGDADRAHWNAELQRRGLRDVEMVGFVHDDDIARYYRAARVFCAPSTGYEALGIVLLEAMAAGAAVVTTDIEGYRTVVRPDVEAVVVPPDDPAALAEGLVRVLRDDDLRARLVEAGHERVEEYAWPRLAHRLLALYEFAGAGPPGAAGVDERLYEVAIRSLEETLGRGGEAVRDGASFDELGIDSLDLAEISFDLERRTGVPIEDPDLAGVRTVADLVALLAARDG